MAGTPKPGKAPEIPSAEAVEQIGLRETTRVVEQPEFQKADGETAAQSGLGEGVNLASIGSRKVVETVAQSLLTADEAKALGPVQWKPFKGGKQMRVYDPLTRRNESMRLYTVVIHYRRFLITEKVKEQIA